MRRARLPDDARVTKRWQLIGLFYEGPWDRLAAWLWAIDWRTSDTWKLVEPGSLRNWLAEQAEKRDYAWKMRWAMSYRKPPRRWKRRERPAMPHHEDLPDG